MAAGVVGELLQKDELEKAFDKFQCMFKNGYLLDNQLIPNEEKRKRINYVLSCFVQFISKLKTLCDLSKLNEEIFQLLTDFVRRGDVTKEVSLLTRVVALYQNLASLSVKYKQFELSLKSISLAICHDVAGNNRNNLLKSFIYYKVLARQHSGDFSFLSKTVIEFIDDTSIKRQINVYEILCEEFKLYMQRNCCDWSFAVINQLLQRENDSICRANCYLMLAKVLYEDKTLSEDKSSFCCDAAIDVLNSITASSFTKWKLLCECYLWKHLCLIQEKRDVAFEECVTSVNSDSDMFDEKKVFNASVSKIICTLPDFESLEKLVDEAFTIWDVHLVENFEKLENKIDRDDFIKLTTDLSGLALLIPKPSFAVKTLLWLFVKRSSFVDWLYLRVLLYESATAPTFLLQFRFEITDKFEICVKDIVDFAYCCCSDDVKTATKKFNDCQSMMSKLDPGTTSYFRLFSFLQYFTTYFLRLPYNKIPEQFKTNDVSCLTVLYDSYRRAFGILKANLGLEMNLSKSFNQQSNYSIFDIVWCLRRIYDLATSYDQCSMPRDASFYFNEGYDLARRLGYPYWTILFLNGYLRIKYLCEDKEAVSEYLNAARNLFGLSSKRKTSLRNNVSKRKQKSKGNLNLYDNCTTTERLRRDLSNCDSFNVEKLKNCQVDDVENILHGLQHKEDCSCFDCSDFLLYSGKSYFITLVQQFQGILCSSDKFCFKKVDLYQKSLKFVIEKCCSSLEISEILPIPNVFSIYASFLYNIWLNVAKRLILDKNFSEALNLIGNFSQYFDSNSLVDSFLLSTNLLKHKALVLSQCIDGDLAGSFASLSLNEKKSKWKVKRAIVKNSKTQLQSDCSQYLLRVLKDISDYGHLLYYPWYREANEFVFLQQNALSEKNAVVSLVECYGIAVRHSCEFIEHRKKTSKKSNLLNRLKRFESFNEIKLKLNEFPNNLTLVLLYLSSNEELILVRLSSRCDPLVVNLGGVLEKFDALLKIKEIHADNKISVKLRDKDVYWSKRFDINNRLKVLVETIENEWFGVYKSLLLGYKQDENFANDANMAISDSVYEVFVGAASFLDDKELKTLAANLGVLSTKLANFLKKLTLKNMFDENLPLGPVVLILDKNLHVLPFESMPFLKNQPVSRAVSLHSVVDALENWRLHNTVDPSNVYYVVNPSKDLVDTQTFFENSFTNCPGWSGCMGQEPSPSEIETAYRKKDLIIYCGHGSGQSHGLGGGDVKLLTCSATVMLMGCGSGRYQAEGSFYEGLGVVSTYQIMHCPSVVACLWEVTDRDIDCYLEHLLCIWMRYKNGKPDEKCLRKHNCTVPNVSLLQEAVALARQFCKLQYATGAASVIYGLPVTCVSK